MVSKRLTYKFLREIPISIFPFPTFHSHTAQFLPLWLTQVTANKVL